MFIRAVTNGSQCAAQHPDFVQQLVDWNSVRGREAPTSDDDDDDDDDDGIYKEGDILRTDIIGGL